MGNSKQTTITPVLVNGVQIWGVKTPKPVSFSKPRGKDYVPHWNSAEER